MMIIVFCPLLPLIRDERPPLRDRPLSCRFDCTRQHSKHHCCHHHCHRSNHRVNIENINDGLTKIKNDWHFSASRWILASLLQSWVVFCETRGSPPSPTSGTPASWEPHYPLLLLLLLYLPLFPDVLIRLLLLIQNCIPNFSAPESLN